MCIVNKIDSIMLGGVPQPQVPGFFSSFWFHVLSGEGWGTLISGPRPSSRELLGGVGEGKEGGYPSQVLGQGYPLLPARSGESFPLVRIGYTLSQPGVGTLLLHPHHHPYLGKDRLRREFPAGRLSCLICIRVLS